MKRFLLVALLFVAALPCPAQRVNTFYAREFVGATQGQKIAQAQAQCNASMTCVIVLDPDLALYATGTLPGKCANCVWVDFRGLNPFASASGALSVRAFGATGDGSTDDSAAINAAIAAAQQTGAVSRVYFPPGRYRLRSCVNVTDTEGIELYGDPVNTTDAAELDSASATSRMAVLLGDTGNCVLDFLGSERVTLRNIGIRVRSDYATPAKVGLLFGRSSTHTWAQLNTVEDVLIFMDSIPAASARGTLGVYNVAAEHFTMNRAHIIADEPLAMASTNVLSLSSPYKGNPAAPASMTIVSMTQNVFRAWANAGTEFWDVYTVSCYECYWSRQPGSAARWAIVLNGARNMNFTGQIEEFPASLLVGTDSEAVHARLSLISPTEQFMWISSATLKSSDISIYANVANTQQFLGGAGTVSGSTLRLGNSSGINNTSITLSNTLVQAVGAQTVTVNSASRFAYMGNDVFTGTDLLFGSKAFSALGTPANGTVLYCTDCNATCTAGASTGKLCARVNGAWAGL
jgi:hypothetical protein